MVGFDTERLYMKIFDMFSETEYTFLRISRGGVYGNTIEEEFSNRKGVFREKDGMRQGTNGEEYVENSKLFVKPEDIPTDAVGNGVRINGKTYDITSMSQGKNFDTGEIEHLKLILERANYGES